MTRFVNSINTRVGQWQNLKISNILARNESLLDDQNSKKSLAQVEATRVNGKKKTKLLNDPKKSARLLITH